MPDGRSAEFDEDAKPPFKDLSAVSACEPHDIPFTYCDTYIDHLSDLLGIPWEHSKTIPFSSTAPYLGFVWNLENHTVSLLEAKKIKYKEAITEWGNKATHTLQEVEQLYGKLLHASLVVPAGQAYLTTLEAMLGIFHKCPFIPCTPPKGTASDLLWWFNRFSNPNTTCEIPGPIELIDREAYSDASSGIGIAIVIGHCWWAWRLLPGWKLEGRDIGWAEAVGFELLINMLMASSTPGNHFKVFDDN
jgi:hypothetical protein